MSQPAPKEDLARIIESARRLGVEIDEEEALQWLAAMAAEHDESVVMDSRTGVFGHKVSMLDFSDADLEHFRKVGRLVEFLDVPGKIETALALSGSAAQSKIQSYPGDADYFERVNIIADTREEACRVLADIMREKAVSTAKGPNYLLIEVSHGDGRGAGKRRGQVRQLPDGPDPRWGEKVKRIADRMDAGRDPGRLF